MIKLITFIIAWASIWMPTSVYLWYTFIKTYCDPENDYLKIVFYCCLAVLSIFITFVPIIYKILLCRQKDNETKPLLQ